MWLLCIAVAQPALSAVAPRNYAAVAAPAKAVDEKEEERSCRSGESTKRFGWKVVRFGVDTLKYLIGLLIIPVGLFLVVMGAAIEIVEWVAC